MHKITDFKDPDYWRLTLLSHQYFTYMYTYAYR